MSDGLDRSEIAGKTVLSVIVVLVLLFDPLPGDIAAAPLLIGAIWGAKEDE